MKLAPEEMLRHTKKMAENIETAKRSVIAVGLPKEKVGGKVYGDGLTVVRVGSFHEYGNPRRSFLRVPFNMKKKEMDAATAAQFQSVFEKGQTLNGQWV